MTAKVSDKPADEEPVAKPQEVPMFQGIPGLKAVPGSLPSKHNPEKAIGTVVARYVGAGRYFIAGVPARDLDQADIDGLEVATKASLEANLASPGPPDGPDLAYQGVS